MAKHKKIEKAYLNVSNESIVLFDIDEQRVVMQLFVLHEFVYFVYFVSTHTPEHETQPGAQRVSGVSEFLHSVVDEEERASTGNNYQSSSDSVDVIAHFQQHRHKELGRIKGVHGEERVEDKEPYIHG